MSTLETLKTILNTKACPTQVAVQRALRKRGVHITQASVSRALRRLGAIKSLQPDGTAVYRLHKGNVVHRAAFVSNTRTFIVHELVERMIANDTLFVIHTKPDGGRYVSQYIDDAAFPSVAGTVAGENTVLVIPMNATSYPTVERDLQTLLFK